MIGSVEELSVGQTVEVILRDGVVRAEIKETRREDLKK